MNRLRHIKAADLLFLIVIFDIAAFTLIGFKDQIINTAAIVFGALLSLLLLFVYSVVCLLFRHIDRFILIIVFLLASLGLVIQYRIGANIAEKQLIMTGSGFLAMILCILLMRIPRLFRRLNWLLLSGSVALLAVLIFIGDEQYGAKNWIVIGGYSFQPSEFVKVALVFILANYLTESRRLKDIRPLIGFVLTTVALLVFERDLGAAVLIFGTALILFYVATGNKFLTLTGMGAGAVGAALSYLLFDHVKARVSVWKNPWATYSTSGYQIAQGLMAIASGGLWGAGLTLGSPKLIPAYHTDFIFAVICEEFGIIAGLCVIAFYLVLIVRGALISLHSSDRYSMLLAFGCTVMLTLQSFVIIGGVIKLIPLTGITLPFVSYGGSSMISCMMLIGILEGVAIHNGEVLEMAMNGGTAL
ncbi:MAG: Lipid II flippase FtsW [Firmicutes bacterium ADurb.Bin182]|nr:MAG: Lipid II flippase FtsW [Firmicutes bacterium ADurb.Bin182]